MYKRLIRPLLFSLDEEQSHTLSEYALQVPLIWKALGAQSRSGDSTLKTNVAGIDLPSPVGLAAGYDKNCRVLKSLIDLGFGFVCGGTITLAERSGNPPKRMVRISESDALLNSLGFPGEGLARIRPRLARLGRYRSQTFASISGSIEEQIAECYRTITPLVAGIELNISSPNTVGLRVFHDPARLRDLVELLRKSETRPTPLLVKLPPWTNEPDERRTALALAETAVSSGADGLVIANTVPVEDGRLAVGKGGLSGAPLLNNTERMTAEGRGSTWQTRQYRFMRWHLRTRARLAHVRRRRIRGTALHRNGLRRACAARSAEPRTADADGGRRHQIPRGHIRAATVLKATRPFRNVKGAGFGQPATIAKTSSR